MSRHANKYTQMEQTHNSIIMFPIRFPIPKFFYVVLVGVKHNDTKFGQETDPSRFAKRAVLWAALFVTHSSLESNICVFCCLHPLQ